MASTWRGLVESALDELGVRGRPGTDTTVSEEDIDGAFVRLGQMLDAWNLDGLLGVGVERPSVVISAVTRELTVGEAEGNDFRVEAPERIDEVLYRLVGDGLSYRLDRDSLSDVVLDGFDDVDGRPSRWHYESSWPVGRLTFDGRFLVGDYVELFFRGRLPDLRGDAAVRGRLLGEEVGLPDGYERAIICNLALELSPRYGVSVSPVTVENAVEGVKMLRSRNLDVPPTDFGEYARGSGGNRGGWVLGYGRRGGW